MEMSIDKAYEILSNGLVNASSEHEWCVAFSTAIDTMRKYQKIKQIAFPLQFCSTDALNHEAIMKICEVLEDGNDDSRFD